MICKNKDKPKLSREKYIGKKQHKLMKLKEKKINESKSWFFDKPLADPANQLTKTKTNKNKDVIQINRVEWNHHNTNEI